MCTWNDLGDGPFALHFVRNKEKEKVDFLIAEGRRPVLLVGAQENETRMTTALRKFQRQVRVSAVQLTETGDSFRKHRADGLPVLVAPAHLWLPRLP